MLKFAERYPKNSQTISNSLKLKIHININEKNLQRP